MGQIIKFPAQASKFGYKRVKKCAKPEDPDQLLLFPAPRAKLLDFTSGMSAFEQALLLDERDDARAAELYLKSIGEHDCVADSYCNLGILQSKQGKTAKAFDSFTAALKENPRHFEAHYNLGNMYFDVNDYRLAQVHYEIAAEVDRTSANVFFNLALVQAINHELDAAVSSLATYQRLVPAEEARNANELMESLKRSLAATRKPKSGSV